MKDFKAYIKYKIIHAITKDSLTEPSQVIININNLSRTILSNTSIEDILHDNVNITIIQKELLREYCIVEKISKNCILDIINDFGFKILYRHIESSINSREYNKCFLELKEKINQGEYEHWKKVICNLFNLEDYNLTILNEDNLNRLNTLVLESI